MRSLIDPIFGHDLDLRGMHGQMHMRLPAAMHCSSCIWLLEISTPCILPWHRPVLISVGRDHHHRRPGRDLREVASCSIPLVMSHTCLAGYGKEKTMEVSTGKTDPHGRGRILPVISCCSALLNIWREVPWETSLRLLFQYLSSVLIAGILLYCR